MSLFDDPIESAANRLIDKKFEEGYKAETNALQRVIVDICGMKPGIKQQHTGKYREGFHKAYTAAKIAVAVFTGGAIIHHVSKKQSDKKR
jgi:hypothetical protein